MTESQLRGVDSAARGSMRLAAYQTYLLTAQREADKLNISPEDRKLISDLLLQIAELQFEQATRTSILVTRLRRSLVLEHLQIEKNAAALLQKLPVKGEDLFGGKFQEILESSITASNTADKTVYKLSAPSSSTYRHSHNDRDHTPRYREPSTQGQSPRFSAESKTPQKKWGDNKPFRGRSSFRGQSKFQQKFKRHPGRGGQQF